MAHQHTHHHTPESYNLAFALAVGLNLLFVVIEAVYALSANSMSLLADAGHNFGDVVGLGLAWFASWLLSRQSGERYSYGHKKMTVLAALINAVLLIITSALIARESIEKLLYPSVVHEWTVIIVAFIGILINGGTALLFLRGRDEDLNIKAAFMHLAADTLISLGVVLAGVIILLTGWYPLDPFVGLIIVVAIVVGTWGLLRNSMNLILDAVPHNVNVVDVRKYFCTFDGVQAIHDLHIWALSTRENALTVHLIMPGSKLTDQQFQQIHHDLLHQHNVHHVTIQVEQGDADIPCMHTESCK